MTQLKIAMINDQTAVILPPELAARLQAKEGGELYIEDGPNGLTLVHPDPVVESQVRTMKEVMDRRTEVLKKLAE